MTRAWGLAWALVLAGLPASAQPAPVQKIRVGLFASSSAIRISSAAPFNLTVAGGGTSSCQTLDLVPGPSTGSPAEPTWTAIVPGAVGSEAPPSNPFLGCTCQGAESLSVTRLATGTSGLYRGQLEVRCGPQGLFLVDQLPLDDYLKGVVPSEVPASFPPEALKAMAVVTRTYTLSHLKHHQAEGFDLCSDVCCQVYRGQSQESPACSLAVDETRGQILSSDGQPIEASFSACCGGHSVDLQMAWPNRAPKACLVGDWDQPDSSQRPDLTQEDQLRAWLSAPANAFCQAAKRSRWTSTFSWVDLEARLAQSLPVLLGKEFHGFTSLVGLAVKRRDSSGRVAELEISTDAGPYTLREDAARWMTSGGRPGVGALFSSLFWLEVNGDPGRPRIHPPTGDPQAAEARSVTFHGAGWGHGVGFCQEGAAGRALAGQSYREIVLHYYPGSKLEGPP